MGKQISNKGVSNKEVLGHLLHSGYVGFGIYSTFSTHMKNIFLILKAPPAYWRDCWVQIQSGLYEVACVLVLIKQQSTDFLMLFATVD